MGRDVKPVKAAAICVRRQTGIHEHNTREREMKKAIHGMIAGLSMAGALALPTAFAAAQAPTPQFDLTKVTDNVYSFRFLIHRAMVVVTSDGVIVTDPINSVAAKNMMDEIKKITDKPVKFVLYSHNHWDHVAGARIFSNHDSVVAQHDRAPFADRVLVAASL